MEVTRKQLLRTFGQVLESCITNITFGTRLVWWYYVVCHVW